MRKGKKAADGSGSIRQRKDGRWEGRYTYTDPRTGKICRSSIYGKTKREVAEKLRATTAEVDRGNYIHDSSMPLEQWVETYFTDYLIPQSAKGEKPNGTEKSYRSILDNHVLPILGRKRLKDITPLDIQRLLVNAENKAHPEKPLTVKTVLNIHGVIHAVLEQAVSSEILQRNPADKNKLSLPGHKPKRPRAITMEELPELLEAIKGHRYESLYHFGLMTGMREGEILGLSWDCIDWKKSAILVKCQLKYIGDGKGFRFVETKNHTDRRVIVGDDVLALLREHKAQQDEMRALAGDAWDNPHNLVFTNELGGHLKPSDVYRNLKRILKKLGMGDVNFHSLRHSYATFAIQAKNNVKTVQANMGHYSAAFTMDTYVSDQDFGKRAEAEDLSRYLQEQISAAKGSNLGSSADG